MNAPLPPDAVAVATLPVDAIVASLSNPRKRFDDAYISELADSIKNHGLIQPITVRPLSLDALFAFNKTRIETDERPTYEIVVGECRWRAAKQAGLAEIPAFWRELDDKQVLEIQVIENLQRRDVHPIEEAEGYQALIARHGYTADQIAAKISKSRSYVYGRLKFASLCRDARDAFYEGRLDASVALLVARIPGETLQKKATKEVTCGYDNQPLSYRNAKTHILHRYTLSLVQATFKPSDATLLPKAGSCTDCDKLSGNCRDLFNDIDDPNVCTDPDCFEAKREARRDQLIAHAEKRKIPVFLGDQGRQELNGDTEYVSLDAEVDDDAEGRTYRQILGAKAPVTAIIEFPYGKKDLAECAPLNALEAALRKAGWKPADAPPVNTSGMTAEQIAASAADRAERERQNAEREAAWACKEAMVATENAWRKKLGDTVWPQLINADLDVSRQTEIVLHALAAAWMRMQVEYTGFEEDALKTYLDITLPKEYDDQIELNNVLQAMQKASLGTLLAMMFDEFAWDSRELHAHMLEDGQPAPLPHTLLTLAEAFEVDPDALREPEVQPKTAKAKAAKPVSPPSNAAQAPASSAPPAAPAKAQSPAKKPAAKKAKAKADPAPTTSANEPAAPAKTTPMPAWPFPTGAQA
jgi:ParB/RepB/Spo0J family partition protein